MKRILMLLPFVLIFAGVAAGQSNEQLPTFEAADVHTSPRVANPIPRGGLVRGGRYELRISEISDSGKYSERPRMRVPGVLAPYNGFYVFFRG